MEVLPCSDVQYTEDSDCAHQNSGTGFVCDGESNCVEHEKDVQTTDCREGDLLVNGEGAIEKLVQVQGMMDDLPLSEGQHGGPSCCDYQVESQRLSCSSHDFEDNSHVVVDTIESEFSSNNREGDSALSEPKWLECDESVALWVKWRGRWQTGIRCARADWPLPTVKAKPTHDRKKYFVIFFPHNRNYSWVDTLVARPINEFPEPIAHKTHKAGLKLVKDLTVARRYIMKKLAVGMLNIVDQFHSEALVETARDVSVWKEFAMESSRCCGYSDLGRMLLKLQTMILRQYMNSDWLQHSFNSWVHRCQNAHTAESIELLKEELFDSILWSEVKSLWDAPVQHSLGSEWKTWKYEVMKWFSMSHPISTGADIEQSSSDCHLTASFPVSRKRPKLEIRRAEAHSSQVEANGLDQPVAVEIDTEFFNRDTANSCMLESEPCKEEDFREGSAVIGSQSIVGDRWDDIVVEAENSEPIQTKDVEMAPGDDMDKKSVEPANETKTLELTPVNEVIATKPVDTGNKNRQCTAFIESKGRQCVRWANEGDVYCCVHLASRFIGSSKKTEGPPTVDTPLCEGTTVLGTRCKHRSLLGSSFCKKHRPRDDTGKTFDAAESTIMRKQEEITPGSDSMYCRDLILVGDTETPLQVDPVSVVGGDAIQVTNGLIEKPEQSNIDFNGTEISHCVGSYALGGVDPCHESPKRYSLYCDQHLPSWLKRARNGKSRIISKEVFIDLLRDCSSVEQKWHLHQACELFYKLFKSILSLRNPVPMEVQLEWALSEACKNFNVGQHLMKLVCSEKERLRRIWDFGADEDACISSSVMDELTLLPPATDGTHEDENNIKCKICSEKFLDDQELVTHWMDNHKKEAQWFFRGYACAICLDAFTNKKMLESHVQERHHVQFVEQCMLLQCIPCKSHFGNAEDLWVHVQSVHPVEFRMSKVAQQQNLPTGESPAQKLEQGSSMENNSENPGGSRKFTCRFCGLKFDLLPDLGRHHQAAHMATNMVSSRPLKKGVRYYAYRLKSGRLSRPRFKKGLGQASYRIKNRSAAGLKKHIQLSKSLNTIGASKQPHVTEVASLGRLAESHCSAVAKLLFSEIQKAKPRPSNLDIISVARSACCKVSLITSLEEKYGALPERLYLKAAKLCSEQNIPVEWHQKGFVCPKGCMFVKNPDLLPPLVPLPNGFVPHLSMHSSECAKNDWEMDECHYVIDSHNFRPGSMAKATVLCADISFGKESLPVACVLDKHLLKSLDISANGCNGSNSRCSMPWESFTYITKPLLDQFLNLDGESLQLGCACSHSTCSPETCDHVYLFDNDYEDAKDIHGKRMRGRFPYDDKGRIIVEEGYLVYECNRMCNCDKTCPNRVLQNGVRVKLEVFKTENKGWAVRAGEPILRGTFVCEFIGEVLDELEANKRRSRFGKDGCSYMYNIDAHTNDMSRLIEGQAQFFIDATKYGNVSRFINHSCSPNLVNHQVLVDSMDCQHAHIGLYASRDITMGEELTIDYHNKPASGAGYPCLCGSPKCSGRIC